MSNDILIVDDLVKHFPIKHGVFSKTVGAVRAVDGISFSIARGSTLSLVGESGSGKTTVGRALLRLIEPTSGTVTFDGIDVTQLDTKGLRALRKRVQLIFQDPFGSLNPRMTVYSVLAEAMKAHGLGDRNSRRGRCFELLEMVGLAPEAADRYPHEFSGGQRQRIGIARALAVEPQLVICDEVTSALDQIVAEEILKLLLRLQKELGVTYLYITHDLATVKAIADEIVVMNQGKVVQSGPKSEVLTPPQHPYTELLLSSVPEMDPNWLDNLLAERARGGAGAAAVEQN